MSNKIAKKSLPLTEIKQDRMVLFLSGFILFCGIIYSFYLGDKIQFWDEQAYFTIAKNIISTHSYTLDGENPTAYWPPGYPIFLSLFISLGASLIQLRIVNFIAFCFSIYLLYNIAKKLSSPSAGLISVVIVICYPVLFYTAGTLYSQTFGTTLFMLILFILFQAETTSVKPFLLVGLLFGYLILTAPTFLFSLFIVSFWVLIFKKERRIRSSIIILFAAFFVIFLWSARNYSVFNSFVLISTSSGSALIQGNSEHTLPNSGPTKEDLLKYYDASRGMNETEANSYLTSKAVEFIKNNKSKTLKLYFLKTLNYFNYHNEYSGKLGTYTSRFKDIIMLFTYWPLLFIFFLRIIFLKHFNISKYELLLIVLYLSQAFFLGIFLTRIRYRLPFDLLLIAIVAIFIYNLISTRKQTSS
ncbi:MAG: glycosyltransferase family 39 protein [Thermodesulfovibrionia bacterium]|nr:glycosyltransferase family 39 protein [Thermodesulfovibrionia bacterium]